MASFTITQLAALKLAIASGARTVAYDGKSVTYHSLTDMLALVDRIEGELGLSVRGRVRRTVASYRSGFGPGRNPDQ